MTLQIVAAAAATRDKQEVRGAKDGLLALAGHEQVALDSLTRRALSLEPILSLCRCSLESQQASQPAG